ncbi:MAG: N-acetylmuramoyl-L-alanine amidase [Richelia sp. RM2_1_2]|nr:N-acetylmuramoyl-L-alanine amidase [Richelia sp. RM1_1_1]NJO60385.1 N-acetylmuramoyl-L-alanine amidase [Richelia sp. RM2_1_2]
MKYGIDIGHNCPPDTGAVNGYEDELNKELATKVAVGLTSLGHEIVIVNPSKKCLSVNNSLKSRCAIANKAKIERYISFHFNAFNGKANGCEVYYASEPGRKIAQPVLDEICKLTSGSKQFFKRGCKPTTLFQVLNGTNAPAILIETCFCDNPVDMEIYKSIGVDRVAAAIVKGLTGQFPKLDDQPSLYIP